MYQLVFLVTGHGGGADDSSKIIIIVCIVLGLLLLAVVGFLIYHYRTSLHKKFKSHARHDQLLVERKTPNGNGKRYVQGNGYGQLNGHSPHVSYKGGRDGKNYLNLTCTEI